MLLATYICPYLLSLPTLPSLLQLPHPFSICSTMAAHQKPTVTSISPLPNSSSRWITLQQLSYTDAVGTPRVWEAAARKTRGSAGVDAVTIGTIIHRPSHPPSTLLVRQFRPPVNATTVEWPAGLVDAGETVEAAALRELAEETGFGGAGVRVLELSPVVASDPGMTTANMQLAIVEVRLGEGEKPGTQRLDEGEFVEWEMVPLEGLYERLVGYAREEGVVVSAKLFHWAAGWHWARKVGAMA